MNQIKIIIGDYFGEGHRISYSYVILTNKTNRELLDAYIISCKKLKFTLDDDTNFEPDYRACNKCDQSYLSNEILNILKENNYPRINECEDRMYDGEFIELLMWIIKQSLPDLEWSFDEIPCFNNFDLGYGLY